MDITLNPETEALIHKKVAAGRFSSADEVIEAAVMLLDERDRFNYLRELILEAEQAFREGKFVEWTPELRRSLRQQAEENARRGVPINPDVCP